MKKHFFKFFSCLTLIALTMFCVSCSMTAHEHTLTEHKATQPTCEEAGNILYYSCDCGELFSDAEGKTPITQEQTIIKPTGHTLTKVEASEPSCDVAGNVEYYSCACGKLFSDSEGKTPITQEQTVISPTGHTLTYVKGKEKTCTTNGYAEHYICACGKFFTDAEGKNAVELSELVDVAQGHNLTRVEASQATCEEAGNKEYYKCGNCETLFTDAEGKNETTLEEVAIPAKGHTLTRVEAKNPSCQEAGNIEYYTCECGGIFADAEGKTPITLQDTVINADGHFLVKVEATEPTCEGTGNSQYYKCECGVMFTDVEGTTPTTVEGVTIPAKGHNAELVEATATISEHYKCSACGNLYADQGATTLIQLKDLLIAPEGITYGIDNFIVGSDNGNATFSSTTNMNFVNSFLYLNGGIGNYNTIEFDVKWSEPGCDAGKVALQMKAGNGTLCFEIYNGWDGAIPAAVVRFPGESGGNLAREELNDITEGEYVHVKVVVNGDKFEMVVNQSTVYSGANVYDLAFWQANDSTYLYTMGVKSSYKNIVLSVTEEQPVNPGDEMVTLTPNDNFAASEEEGTTVYTNNKTGDRDDSFIYMNGIIKNYNTVEFDAKLTDATADSGKVGVQMVAGGGTLCFEVYNGWQGAPTVAIVRFPGVVSGNLARVELANFVESEYFHIKITASKDVIAMYVNDTEIYKAVNSYGDIFFEAGNKTYIYAIAAKISCKNIAFSLTDLTIEEEFNVTLKTKNFTETTVGETTEYTTQNKGDSFIYFDSGLGTYDTVEFDVKWNNANADYGKVGIQMNVGGGTLCFELWNGWDGANPVAIVRYPGVVSGNIARVELDKSLEGGYFKVKVVANSTTLAMYVNGNLIYEGENTYSGILWAPGESSYLYAVAVDATYTNIKIYKS